MSRSNSLNNRRRDDLDEYWFEKIPVTTKTPEEIREHTIPDNLSSVDRTLVMLDSRYDTQRLAGIRSISSLMISDRDETFRRVLPKFKLIIEQTVDHDEHILAAEILTNLIRQQSLTYQEFLSNFSQIICTFIFPTTTNRFSIVDFGAIWCQALSDIIDVLPHTISLTSLLDLIFSRTLHGSYVRDRLANILAKLSTHLHSQTVENRLVPVFKNFINDTNADIRTLACQKLSIIAQSIDSNRIVDLILPLLVILSKDDNLTVRQTCFQTLLDLRTYSIDSKSINEMIISLVKYAFVSKSSQFLSIIALRLDDLCQTLTIFHLDEDEFIHELFLRLIQEKNVPDCRLGCAKNFSSIVEYLGQDILISEFDTIFQQFCTDSDPKIRSIMLTTIINLAKLNRSSKNKQYLSIIWNGFLSILSDTHKDLLLAIAKNLFDIFLVFSREKNEGLLNGAISTISSVPDSDTFLTRLLDYERRIFETTLSWRSCILCLQAFLQLPYILTSEQLQTKILSRVFSRIFSKQVCVREIAVDSYVQLLRKIPRRTIRKNAFQKLINELLLNHSYQWRVMFVRACRQILVHYSKKFFKEFLFEHILSLQNDPVLSVRIHLIPLLVEIKSILRYPADRQLILKIESLMRCFLADKTITLHDLANNGLLQLDQIRSYNTLLNHSSDDSNDQKKENEEELLDEIDSSARRSSKKFNEQNTLSKRLTDTSISSKQIQTNKSPKLTRRASDDSQRKSSASSELNCDLKEKRYSLTKQQRQQIAANSNISSRLANQTTTKKSSK